MGAIGQYFEIILLILTLSSFLIMLASKYIINRSKDKNEGWLAEYAKSLFPVFLVVFLILSTALVKNSTKRIDDEIFTIKENIRALKKDFENIKLEYEFLSSTEKLLEFQNLYFDDELVKKDINEIKIIDQSTKKLQINNLILGNE